MERKRERANANQRWDIAGLEKRLRLSRPIRRFSGEFGGIMVNAGAAVLRFYEKVLLVKFG